MMAMAAVVAVAGASLALVTPTSAGNGVGITVTGAPLACNTLTGEVTMVWTVTNNYTEDMTVDYAFMTPPSTGTDLTSQFPGPIAANGGQGSASGVVPAGTTSVNLLLDYTVGSTKGYGDFPATVPAGTCPVPTGPSSLQVGPSAAGPGESVTISGAGCSVPTTNGTAAILDTGGTVTGSIAFDPPLAFGPVTAGPDGTWSTSIVVPVGTPAGSYAVSAQCAFAAKPLSLAAFSAVPASIEAQAAPPTGFAYATKYLTVVSAATPRALAATPRQTG